MLVYHPDTELMAATDWGIDGTLLDADGNPLDLSDATLTWTLIGPQGTPVLADGDATVAVVDPTAGTIHIAVHHDKAASLEAGRYLDSLQVAIGDIIRRCGSGRYWSPPTRGGRWR